MKKKNSTYTQESDIRLTENIIYEHYREEFISVIDKFNDYNNPLTTKITSDGTIEGLTKKDHFFFSRLYVPFAPLRTIDKLREDLLKDIREEEIGVLEWQLILFATSFGKAFHNNRIVFLSGNIGEGKSSLINYVLKYLYLSKKQLKSKILPIILNCQGHKTKLQKQKRETGDIFEFIDSFIRKSLNNKLKNYTAPDNNDFWEWYENQDFNSDYGPDAYDLKHSRFEESKLEKELINLRKEEKKRNEYFAYLSSYYLVQKQKKDIVFVFDNVDPFEIGILSDFYWKAKFIVNNSPIKVIISLRPGTYKKLERHIEEINIIKTIEVKTDLSKILASRCDFLLKRIETQEKKKPLTLSVYGQKSVSITNNPYDSLKKIINALLHDNGKRCLVTFSNKNIRNQLELLRIVFSSGFLTSSELGKILLSEGPQVEIPSEFIVSTITTFGHNTFYSKICKQLDIPGLLNVLSTSYHRNPIQIFTKLFILRNLHNKGFSVDNDKDDIISHFNSCVKNMDNKKELLNSFIYSFYRLFNKGLISSPDIHIAKSINEFTSKVKDVRLSGLGEYYHDQLLTDPFYLIFIKDDVYLPDTTSFENVVTIKKNNPSNRYFWLNIKQLICFLKEYGKLEIAATKMFIDHETFDIYKNNFGCYSSNLFTIKILEELKKFVSTNNLKSDQLRYFLETKQIFNSTDFSHLDETIDFLEDGFQELLN